jgi:hypothetical protein
MRGERARGASSSSSGARYRSTKSSKEDIQNDHDLSRCITTLEQSFNRIIREQEKTHSIKSNIDENYDNNNRSDNQEYLVHTHSIAVIQLITSLHTLSNCLLSHPSITHTSPSKPRSHSHPHSYSHLKNKNDHKKFTKFNPNEGLHSISPSTLDQYDVHNEGNDLKGKSGREALLCCLSLLDCVLDHMVEEVVAIIRRYVNICTWRYIHLNRYVCIHIYIYIYIYTCLYSCIYMQIWICVYMNSLGCVLDHMDKKVVGRNTYLNKYMYVHVCKFTFLLICMHINIYT